MGMSEAVTITYLAWNTNSNEPETGDVANHTIRYIKDGVAASPAASPAEVELGEYSILLSATENVGKMMAVVGSSVTSNIEIIKSSWQNIRTVGIVTVVSTVSVDGTALVIVRGDDYLNTDSRAVEFSSTGWPDLTADGGAAVTLTIRLKASREVELTVTGTVVDADTCRFDLTHTLTDELTPSSKGHIFDVEAILGNDSYVTLVLGDCTVLEDVTR